MRALADVPLLIVALHLIALAAFLSYGVITQLRRLSVLRQSRRLDTGLLRLLQVSLGLSRAHPDTSRHIDP